MRKTCPSIFNFYYRKKSTKIWVDKRTDFADEYKHFCRAEALQVSSILSDTEAAISALLNVHYDPWKSSFTITGKNMSKTTSTNCLNLSQSWTLEKFFDGLDTKDSEFEEYDFLSFLYRKPRRAYRKPMFKIRYIVRIRISMYSLPFARGYKPLLKHAFFSSCWNCFHRTTSLHNKEEQDEVTHGKLYE